VQHFDGDYVEWVLERLGRAPGQSADRGAPASVAAVMAHLRVSVERSMGRIPQEPFRGSWFSVHVLGPLALGGLVPLPGDGERPEDPSGGQEGREGETAALKAVLEEYLALVQADELPPTTHPLYGPLDVAGWERFHLRHFEHHLARLGV